jgi:hypothetical protein
MLLCYPSLAGSLRAQWYAGVFLLCKTTRDAFSEGLFVEERRSFVSGFAWVFQEAQICAECLSRLLRKNLHSEVRTRISGLSSPLLARVADVC